MIKIFEPTGRSMKQEYPELNDIEEFRDLSDEQLRFAWFVGNPTSPTAEDKADTRMRKALDSKFGATLSGKQKKKYMVGKLPDELKAAVIRMELIEPSYRLSARLTTEEIYKNLNKIVYLESTTLQVMSMAEKKQYSETALKIGTEMPRLVETLERGFGVKTDSGKDDNKEISENYADKVMDIIDEI